MDSYAGSWTRLGSIANVGEAGEPKELVLSRPLIENEVVGIEIDVSGELRASVLVYSNSILGLDAITAKPSNLTDGIQFVCAQLNNTTLTSTTSDHIQVWRESDNKTLWIHTARAHANVTAVVYTVSNI